eukprot:m51a1_g10538 hypothetical protein (749) ;mRNA; r:2902-5885
MCRCGRFVRAGSGSQAPVPVTGVAFDVSLLGFCAEVRLRQRFENTESDPIEATFEFLLESSAAVTAFSATIDGKEIKATLKEKEKARQTYDDAIARGGGAYMLEESSERRNLFTVSVGNLPPGQEALVTLSYVTEAQTDDAGNVVFTLPGGPAIEMGAANPKSAFKEHFPKPFSIRATFEMVNGIKSITSKTHPIAFELGDAPNRAAVSYSPDTAPTTSDDFALLVQLADPFEPMARVQRDSEGNSVAMLSFYPRIDTDKVPTELLFLVDRSGSMEGESICQVKQTLQFFLRSLPEGVFFNIIGFGSSHYSLFDKSVEYGDKSLETAAEHVRKMDGDMGGTDVLSPLTSLYGSPPLEGFSRQIFLLTDGQVENADRCIDVVRAHANTTRVFTFGIGSGVDRKLVYGIAKAGEGQCELISESNSMSQKVLKQLARALKPAITDVKLDWGGLPAKQTPFILPPLFRGSCLVVYTMLDSGEHKGVVTLSGKLEKRSFSWPANVDTSSVASGSQIVKLASRSLIRYAVQQLQPQKKQKQSVCYSTCSPTSCSAKVAAIQAQVDDVCCLMRQNVAATLTNMERAEMIEQQSEELARNTPELLCRDEEECDECECEECEPEPEFIKDAPCEQLQEDVPIAKAAAHGQQARCMDIVSAQRANGSWMPESLELVGIDCDKAMGALPSALAGVEAARVVWATLLVVAVLRARFASARDEWCLIVDKAVKWASRAGAGLDPAFAWESQASEYVGALSA